jgi:hypothetical protein
MKIFVDIVTDGEPYTASHTLTVDEVSLDDAGKTIIVGTTGRDLLPGTESWAICLDPETAWKVAELITSTVGKERP